MPAYVNGAYSVVALAPSPNPATSTSMTLSVGDGALFPDPASVGPYDISIWPSGAVYRGGSGSGHGEICTVTAKSVDTLTIVRGAQSSTARVVIAGDQVAYTVSAGIFANFTLLNGQAGGQALSGGIAASENLVLHSTTHATKGKIFIGPDLYYDEATNWLLMARASGSTASNPYFWIEEGGSGDPRFTFAILGSTIWEVGIDNSDGDAFKINQSTGVGDFTDVGLRIDTDGTAKLQQLILDRNYSGSTVSSRQLFITERGSADPRIDYEVSGVTGWIGGIDNSDDDAYKIQNSTGYGDFNSAQGYLRIDRNGAVLVNGQANGISSLEIGQDVAGTYARLRLRGRYAGASGTGLWDVEALNDQIYLFDRTNGAYRFLVFTNGVVEVPGSLSIGAGASPFTGLDVETGVGATYGKFGNSLPMYMIAPSPSLGFNSYYNGGWKFGKGSTSHYGAWISFQESVSIMSFGLATAPGAANGAMSFAVPLQVTPAHVTLPLLTSTGVLATDSSGNIVAGSTSGFASFADVMDHGGVGNGSTDDRAAIAACDALGIGIIFRGGHTYKIGSNLTITSAVIFGEGAKLLIPTGVLVTLNGSILAAPLEWIFTFTGTGAITFGAAVNFANVEWFGAGMGSTDDLAAVNLCIAASQTYGVEVRFNVAYVTCPSASIHCVGDVAFHAKAGSFITTSGAATAFIIEGGASTPRKVTIPSMLNFSTCGLLFWGATNWDVENIGWSQANAIHCEWLIDSTHTICSSDKYRVVNCNAGLVVCLVNKNTGGVYLEGNALEAGFVDDFSIAALQYNVIAGPDPQFNGFEFKAIAVDINGHTNAYFCLNNAALGIPLCSFNVTSWCGGYDVGTFPANNIQILAGYWASLNMYLANHNNLIGDNYHWTSFANSGDTNHIVIQGKSTLYRTITHAMSPYQVIDFEAAFGDELFLTIDASGGVVTVNLPYAQAADHRITIMKVDNSANAITIARNPATGQVIFWPTGAVAASRTHSGHQFGILQLENGYNGATPNWYVTIDT